MKKRSWTAAEDDIIRAYGTKVSLQRLAVKVNRSKSVVKARAKLLAIDVKEAPRLEYRERIAN